MRETEETPFTTRPLSKCFIYRDSSCGCDETWLTQSTPYCLPQMPCDSDSFLVADKDAADRGTESLREAEAYRVKASSEVY